jgi:hypothetical protein
MGRLEAIDTDWGGYTGSIAISTKPLRFAVEEVLKGDLGARATVEYVLFGEGEWVDEAKGKGLRLSPRFFRPGSRYIVLATERDSLSGKGLRRLYVDGDDSEGIWLATPENRLQIRRLLGLR